MNKRFEALDAFRGLCALAVVAYHMHLLDAFTEWDFFRSSWLFVEFFFVLSGFVLTHSYGFKTGISFRSFMVGRFLRIYPLHFFMFLVFVTFELAKLLAYRYGGVEVTDEPFTHYFAISEMLPNLLLLHAWTPHTEYLSFNNPSWSISIEFYLYVFFILSILLIKRYRVLVWCVLTLTAFYLIHTGSDILVKHVLRGTSCFFGGAVLYMVYQRMSSIKMSYTSGTIVECVLLFSVVLVVQSDMHLRTTLAPVLFMLIVLFFAFEFGGVSKFLQNAQLQYIGRLSYSIYMTHAAVLFCVLSAARMLSEFTNVETAPLVGATRYMNFGGSVINNVVAVLILAMVVYISGFTYKLIEVRGQKIMERMKFYAVGHLSLK